jgi:hypothetical protein
MDADKPFFVAHGLDALLENGGNYPKTEHLS